KPFGFYVLWDASFRKSRKGATLEPAIKQKPRSAGLLFLIMSASPFLAPVPIIDFLLGLIFLIAIVLLQLAFELVFLPGDDIKVIVREFTPLLLDLAFDLLPVSFDAIPVHRL